MLGLGGFRVLSARQVAGELEVVVETTAERAWCRRCGVRAQSKERPVTLVRDLDAFGTPVALHWVKRRWRCPEPACATRTWTERCDLIVARAVLTERARERACRQVGRDGQSVAKVARDLGVGWHTVMDAVRDYGSPLVDDPDRVQAVTALGLDETAFLKAKYDHGTIYVTGMVDARTGRLLDVVPDRTAQAVADWLAERDQAWLDRIDTVSIDPHQGYANAVAWHLGDATLVVDHFHAVKLGNASVDDVRRRVQQHTTGHRGRRADPLYRIRRVLLTGAERMTARQWQRLEAAWDAADPDDEVYLAWAVKEALRDVYRADCVHGARVALADFYDWADGSGVPESRRLAATVRRWEAEILAYHVTGGVSSGRVEAINLLIKKIKRVGHGFRNFDNYRLRLLLHCGVTWQDEPVTRLRGRRPRLAA